MKKRYRIGICLTLIICLLFLSACGKKQDPPANDPTQPVNDPTQASEGTTEILPSENSTETTGSEIHTPQEDVKNNLPEELAFNWKASFLQSEIKFNIVDLMNGKLFTLEELQAHVDRMLQFNTYGETSLYAKALKSLPYTKDFYDNNSLILIPIMRNNYTELIEVTDVTYADGVLKCFVTKTKLDRQTQTWSPDWFGSPLFYCFVEIDTVIPEGTEIVVETSSEAVEDYTVYEAKRTRFLDQCIWCDYVADPDQFITIHNPKD